MGEVISLTLDGINQFLKEAEIVGGELVLTKGNGDTITVPLGTVDQADIDAAIAGVVGGAPGALNTLDELAAALNDDANLATTLTNLIAGVKAGAMGVVIHGAVAATARPAGYATIQWIGSVQPTNMADNDFWFDTSGAGGGGGGSSSTTYPKRVQISPFIGAKSHVNWNTISIDAPAVNSTTYRSSGAQNDEIVFDVLLGAGTWTLDLIGLATPGSGIITVLVDGVSVGTIDMYAGANNYAAVKALAGIVIAAGGNKVVTLRMATKNASSSGYLGAISELCFKQTA